MNQPQVRRRPEAAVGKGLYTREDRMSPLRAVELGSGLALGAWGLSRSPMVGRALAVGVRQASRSGGSKQAADALRLAMQARGSLRAGTAPTGPMLRRIGQVNRAIEAVPAHLRPSVAMTAGALLAGNGMPVRTTRYRPIPPGAATTAYRW